LHAHEHADEASIHHAETHGHDHEHEDEEEAA
jgi:hypothetical protein